MHFHYQCNDCGYEFESDDVTYLCPHCAGTEEPGDFRKGVLWLRYDKTQLRALKDKDDLSTEDFTPYPDPRPGAFPCGPTPLVRPAFLGDGIDLTLKLDSQLISGSFKDRASHAVACQAYHHGIRQVALASTGNAGAAMSAIGAAYGLSVKLFVPASAPVNKLMQSVLYGATVIPVKGTYDDAFGLSSAYTERCGGINRNTAYNPITIEGKKAVSIELFLQLGRRVPDIVYVPVGDGCIFSGVYKGFLDLFEAGLTDHLPRLVACQSSGSDAITKAFETGLPRPVKASTLADSISVSSPAAGLPAIRGLKESGGHCVRVDDDEILKAQRTLAAKAGIFVEPAAAAAWAGFEKDSSHLPKGCSATVLLTGTGFKDMSVFEGRVSLPEPIEPTIEAVMEGLGVGSV